MAVLPGACGLICAAAQSSTYKVTAETKKLLGDLAIVSHIRAALQEICEAEVNSNDGFVHINVGAQKIRKTGIAGRALQMHIRSTIKKDLTNQILDITRRVPGVKHVVCDVGLPYY